MSADCNKSVNTIQPCRLDTDYTGSGTVCTHNYNRSMRFPVITAVSVKTPTASIIRVTIAHRPDNGGCTQLSNVGLLL